MKACTQTSTPWHLRSQPRPGRWPARGARLSTTDARSSTFDRLAPPLHKPCTRQNRLTPARRQRQHRKGTIQISVGPDTHCNHPHTRRRRLPPTGPPSLRHARPTPVAHPARVTVRTAPRGRGLPRCARCAHRFCAPRWRGLLAPRHRPSYNRPWQMDGRSRPPAGRMDVARAQRPERGPTRLRSGTRTGMPARPAHGLTAGGAEPAPTPYPMRL